MCTIKYKNKYNVCTKKQYSPKHSLDTFKTEGSLHSVYLTIPTIQMNQLLQVIQTIRSLKLKNKTTTLK